jgi:hypothetical protein
VYQGSIFFTRRVPTRGVVTAKIVKSASTDRIHALHGALTSMFAIANTHAERGVSFAASQTSGTGLDNPVLAKGLAGWLAG